MIVGVLKSNPEKRAVKNLKSLADQQQENAPGTLTKDRVFLAGLDFKEHKRRGESGFIELTLLTVNWEY